MFDSRDQLEDMRKLWKAMDKADQAPPCENFPDAFFPDYSLPGSMMLNNMAKSLCAQCPIKAQCAEYGIRWESQGIYGGISPRERQQMRSTLRSAGHRLPDLAEVEEAV